MVVFSLDSTRVTPPVNWEELRLKLTRDRDLDTLLFTAETTFEWDREGAAYLNELITTQGFCGTVDIDIIADEQDNTTIFQGTIFLASCETDEQKGTIKTKVEDRTFYKSVNSNKSIETVISTGKSKDATVITPADRCLISVHDHSTLSDVKEIYTVRVYEAFRYLIEFMSNGTLSFASDTFDMGGEWEGLVITSGLKLRATINNDGTETGYKWPNPALPAFSFYQLYTEVKKKIPIGITIEGDTLRLEAVDYYYQSDNGGAIFTDVERVITKFDQERLYSAVKVGSTKIELASSFDFPEGQNAIGFKEEQFTSDIACNIDRTLDLVSNWIISSNVIHDCLVNLADSYDDDIFFITCTLSDAVTGQSTRDDIFGTGKYFFNDELRNVNVLLRYSGGVPAGLLQYNGQASPYFTAELSADILTQMEVTGAGTTPSYAPTGVLDDTVSVFDTEVSDPSNVYNLTVSFPPNRYNVFTAPADALYGFEVFCDFVSNVSESGAPNPSGSGQFKLQGFAGNPVIQGAVQWELWNGTTSLGSGLQVLLSRTYYKLWSSVAPNGVGGWSPETIYGGGTTPDIFRIAKYMKTGWRMVITPLSSFGNFTATQSGGWDFGTLELDQHCNLREGSYFNCYSSSLGDLTLPLADINEYIVRSHSFTVPMDKPLFEALKAASREKVQFAMNGQDLRSGWIQEVNYAYMNGTADIKLISKTN